MSEPSPTPTATISAPNRSSSAAASSVKSPPAVGKPSDRKKTMLVSSAVASAERKASVSPSAASKLVAPIGKSETRALSSSLDPGSKVPSRTAAPANGIRPISTSSGARPRAVISSDRLSSEAISASRMASAVPSPFTSPTGVPSKKPPVLPDMSITKATLLSAPPAPRVSDAAIVDVVSVSAAGTSISKVTSVPSAVSKVSLTEIGASSAGGGSSGSSSASSNTRSSMAPEATCSISSVVTPVKGSSSVTSPLSSPTGMSTVPRRAPVSSRARIAPPSSLSRMVTASTVAGIAKTKVATPPAAASSGSLVSPSSEMISAPP